MRRKIVAQSIAIAAAAFVATGNTGTTVAALGDPVKTESGDRERLFEWSPLVRDIQVYLIEFGLISGSADGRLTQEFRDAVQTYQRRHKLTEDGEASKELLQHMNSVGRPESLKSRLEEVRHEQIEEARKALARNPETSDLIGAAKVAVSQPGATTPDACLREPNADCLIGIALSAADTIGRDDYRDWALREIVQAQARSGKLAELRQSIRRISDTRLIIVSLREASGRLVDAGRLGDAKALAQTIPDDWNHARALAAIAAAEAGQPVLAETIEGLQRLLNRLEDKVAASEISTQLAVDLAAKGETDKAVSLLELTRGFANPPADAETRQALLAIVAGAYARIGRTDDALKLLKSVGDIGRDHIALAEAAGRIARNNLPKDAIALADRLRAPRLHVLALSKIAMAQSRHGDVDASRQTLKRAMNASLDIVRPFAADTAAAELAEVWATLPDYDQAFATIGRIKSRALRAQTLWQLEANTKHGDPALRNRAKAATDEIDSAFDRAAVLAEAALNLAVRSRPDDARALFDSALRNARTVETDWWRARIFSRLAGTLPEL
jgi:tetratricopeptide (TPR) repeat protein